MVVVKIQRERAQVAAAMHLLRSQVNGPHAGLDEVHTLEQPANGVHDVAWAAHRHRLNLVNSPLAFMGSTAAVAVFTLLALGELIIDKLPATPNRTKLPGLIGR